jgi:hypothetical protein
MRRAAAVGPGNNVGFQGVCGHDFSLVVRSQAVSLMPWLRHSAS